MDEELAVRRVYGADHDGEQGPVAGRSYVELVGGPLDGLLLDITGWSAEDIAAGAALPTELSGFTPGGRALYDPRPGDGSIWDWSVDMP